MRSTKRMLRTIAATAAIALLAVTLVACSDDDHDDDAAAPPAATQATRPSRPVQAAATAAAAEEYAYEAAATEAAAYAQDSADGATATQAASSRSREAVQESCANCMSAGSAARTEPAAPQRPGPSDATFRNYGRTPFIDASTDAVSTFSLDTDRTSYYLALTWAQNGYTVEPDSVRAEEWVNAFAYDYDAPRYDDSFAITSDVVEHPLGDGRHIARIAFQAPTVRDDTPLNVTLVLDASGSMSSGNRVDIAREAAEAIRQSLSDRDRIAVVHFTTEVIHQYTVEHSRPDSGSVARSIARLAPHGSTNVQAGLDLGVRLADEARRQRPDAYNYIILMSDGVANVDATNPFAILESANDADNRNPLRLITIGVGIDNYNDYLLEQLAQHGNGWYRYLDDTAQARETFSRQNWLALSTPFADQARAQVTWDPRLVQSWRIIGYENRITPDHTFEQNRREFAELPSGTATTVFYELFLRSEARSGRATLGSVEVRWVDPSSGTSLTQSAAVWGRTNAPFDAGDRHLRFGAIVALASDRYSALSPQVENAAVDAAGIHADLLALLEEFGSLEERLGSLDAYRDFGFLLDQLTARAGALAPSSSSGYSQ